MFVADADGRKRDTFVTVPTLPPTPASPLDQTQGADAGAVSGDGGRIGIDTTHEWMPITLTSSSPIRTAAATAVVQRPPHGLPELLDALGLASAQQRRQVTRLIEQGLQSLPARQREAFLLRYWEELDVQETARAMGCSEGSVKTHCSRATHALAKVLRSKGITL